ncbi:MAG: putative sulfate/molybdate transporter [Anaerolineae bacterium]|nr:putative sulfate/molybdate transporter [Anaerolineae bacterium]
MERDPRQYRDFEFNLRELAGSMGDFGTLFPLAIGLIAVCGVDPTALFVMIGLTNLITGIVYRLPMPVEPKKVIAVTAIAQGWSASLVTASGLGLGLLWLLVVISGAVRKLAKMTPLFLIRGIQLALGVSLGVQAVRMIWPNPLLGLLAIGIILALRKNRYAPAALVIMVVGIVVMAWEGNLGAHLEWGFSWPRFSLPRWSEVWQAMVLAGFAQVPLTLTNAVLATAAMIRELFPEKPVSEERLLLNMGLMNVASSFFGGMPMCHGSGGLAGQYYFGARTGGANILEGLIEISLGVFLGRSLLAVLRAFPLPLVGGMMFMVGIQLVRPILKLRRWPLALGVLTAAVSVYWNMGVGFLVGLLSTQLARWAAGRGLLSEEGLF